MNDTDILTFASKRDAWLAAIIVITDLVIVFALFALVAQVLRTRQWAIFPGIAICIVSFALLTWVFVATQYRVRDGRLLVRSGPFRWQIPIADIERVDATHNPLSSPALSLDRLSIKYRTAGTPGEILVSPRDKSAFIQALRSVNPAIATQ